MATPTPSYSGMVSAFNSFYSNFRYPYGSLSAIDCRKLEELAAGIAKSFGGSAEFEWKDFTSPLINDETASKEAQETACRYLGKENVITSRQPSLGGDDFAEYILKVPGVYGYVGTGNSEKKETIAAQHDSMFDIDEDSLKVSVGMYVMYTLDFLQ